MDLMWLEVFREVCRRGSFTSAAQSLQFTQSAVSRQVAALEADLGATLFERAARGVRLTPEGQSLQQHVEAVLARLDAARHDLDELRNLSAGRLRLGSFATANAALVPRAMTRFREQFPRVVLSLSEALSPVLLSQVRDGDIDVGIVGFPSGRKPDTQGLDLTHLLDDTIMLAIPRVHRLAKRRTVRFAELADEQWIAGWDNLADSIIGATLPPDFRPEIRYVIPGWTAKLGLVAAGLGVTLMSGLAASSARADVLIKRLHPDEAPVGPVFAATALARRPVAAEPFAKALVDIAQELRRDLAMRSPHRS